MSVISENNLAERTRKMVESNTRQTLENLSVSTEDQILQHPPSIHPSKYIPNIVDKYDIKITYLAPTKFQRRKVVKKCSELGIDVHHVRSEKEKCESYNGNYGEVYSKYIRDKIEDNLISLGALHATGDLKCQLNGECPFTSTKDEIDLPEKEVLVGDPVIAYMDDVCENRRIFIDGVTGDEFISKIDKPTKELEAYFQDHTPFSSYTDFIRNRNRKTLLEKQLRQKFDASERDPNRVLNGEHPLAPLIFFGLQHTVELNNGWETTYKLVSREVGENEKAHFPANRYKNGVEIWSGLQLDYRRHRVVRDPGTEPTDDTIYLLDIPDFSSSKGLIGLDIDPVKRVWDICYGTNFQIERVLNTDETKEFLQDVMNVSVIQTADSLKPYDGTNVTPGRDASLTLWAEAEYGQKPIVVTTKNAIEDFYREKQPELLEKDVESYRQYRKGHRLIDLDEPVIIANGAPRPRNEEFQMLGAFQGESVPGDSDSNNSFGEIGNEIRHQFMHSRVGRAVTNFEGRGATIILNTTAHPDWLPDPKIPSSDPMNILPDNASAKRKIVRTLRDQDSPMTINGIVEKADVAETSARNAVDELKNEGWIIIEKEGGPPFRHQWVIES